MILEGQHNCAQEWDATFDTIPDAIALCDQGGTVVRANRAFLAAISLGRSQFSPLPVEEALSSLCLSDKVRTTLLDAIERRAVLCLEESPPGGRTLTLTFSPLGEPAQRGGVVLLIRDVTAERRMQRRMLLGERMAAVGQLAAGLAHEINNPISFAYSNLQLANTLLREVPLPEGIAEIPEMLTDALSGLTRVRDIVRDLKTFTSTEVRTLSTTVRLDDLLENAVRLIRSEVQARARLVYERDLSPLPPIQGDPGKLSHVLLNLLAHALHNLSPEEDSEALGDVPQSITIRTRVDPQRGGLELLVADTGPPLSEETRSHLFEPFATRHPRLPPQRTAAFGMGLAVSYEVIRHHGGEIEARPGPNGENELLVWLPLSPG